jgi:hypothetical protein
MDKTELSRIRAICDAATQGEWHVRRKNIVYSDRRTPLFEAYFHEPADWISPEKAQANATYAATFDPPTVRRLLDLIEEKQS